jgi:hypothetical protein
MITTLQSERVAITCSLGVRFIDVATRTVVSDALSVEAYRTQNVFRRVAAVPNRSGIWGFHGLSGLHQFEYGLDDERRWTPEPPKRHFVVEVTDGQGRFLPCRIFVDVPQRVLSLEDELVSPPSLSPWNIPLYSGPARRMPGGLAVVRTQIFEGGGDTPAAWALVKVSVRVLNRVITAQGVADGQGRLALIFPYPEPTNVGISSPIGGGPQLLSQQSWTLTFRAWHTFDPKPGDFVDLDRVLGLTVRTPDHLWDYGSPFIPFTTADLVFGRELVVPVRLPGDLRPRKLFITPAGSPS